MPDRLQGGFPLFPLGIVALPTESVPLHIFEDRYRTMIEECLEHEREFGIVWMAEDELKPIGCACEIDRVLERMEDGRMNIMVRGTRPFRLIERQDDLPYPAGVVEFLDEHAEEADPDIANTTRELYAELVNQATDSALSDEELRAFDAYRMAATVEFGADAKQELLELRSENARLRLLTMLFRAAIKRMELVERAQRARSLQRQGAIRLNRTAVSGRRGAAGSTARSGAGHGGVGRRVAAVEEGEGGGEGEAPTGAAARQQDALRAVADQAAVEVFVVGDVLGPERGTQPHDRDIRAGGEAWDEREADVDTPAERRGRPEQQTGEDDLGAYGARCVGVEEQREMSVLGGGSHDRDPRGLVDDGADGDLRERAAVSHARLGRAAGGPVFFERFGRAGRQAQAAERNPEVRGVAHIDPGQRSGDPAGGGGDLKAEADRRARSQPLGRERRVERHRLRGLCAGRRTEADQGRRQESASAPHGFVAPDSTAQYESLPVVWTVRA